MQRYVWVSSSKIMNNYFTQFIPLIGRQDSNGVSDQNLLQQDIYPRIAYILIFNPSAVNDDCESDEELAKQIICFASSEIEEEIGELYMNDNIHDKLKAIGTVRGINSFMRGFSNSPNRTNIIKTDTSIIIVKPVEKNYYIICKILISASNRSSLISRQMSKLIDEAYNYFVLYNGSYRKILHEYKLDILMNSLNTYWYEFLHSYNTEHFKFPSRSKWTNSLNYKGFLGLLEDGNDSKIFKKSSIQLNNSIRSQIDSILSKGEDKSKPKGLIVSFHDKSVPKKYGMIYSNSSLIDGESDRVLENHTLVDIYNWLEYFDHHHKLDSVNLTASECKNIFASPEIVRNQLDIGPLVQQSSLARNDSDSRSVISNANSTFDMINPIQFTNDYIILPFNNTVNNVMNFSTISRTEDSNEFSEQSRSNKQWLRVPYYLNPFGQSTSLDNENLEPNTHSDDYDSDNRSSDEELDDEYGGEFLIGIGEETDTSYNIHKKLVYLSSGQTNDNGKIIYEEREYLLVCYIKNNILISLVYDSSLNSLDQTEFYSKLSKEILNPLTDEISNALVQSTLGNSVGSLQRSLDALKVGNSRAYLTSGQESDSSGNFYFIVFDIKEKWIKSSLPYLPMPDPGEIHSQEDGVKFNKAAIRYKSTIFYLHDQLSDLFVAQDTSKFFKDANMNEYFHKFNSSKHFDWMFYYIKTNNKYIIVIKSRSRNHRIASKQDTYTTNNKVNNFTSSSSTTTSTNPNLLHQISDYTNLGFLNNLGDDVKLWLESFSINDEI